MLDISPPIHPILGKCVYNRWKHQKTVTAKMPHIKIQSQYDVIIVGAGPAGSTLGYLLSSNGLDVLVIDRESFPRVKLCGGGVTWKTRMLLEELFGEPFDQAFAVEASSEDYAIYEREKLKVFQSSPEPFYFVDLQAYDFKLISLAKDKSCRFLFGQKIVDIDLPHQKVITSSGTSLQSKIVVGADGINSLVRKKIFPQTQFNRYLSLGFQVDVSNQQVKTLYRTPVPKFFFGYSNWGYGWIFSYRDHFVVGICGLIRKNPHLKNTFISFLRNVTEMNIDDKSVLSSHMGPSGNFMGTPAEGNVLLLGDAAGLADPLTGEGIYYAHKSAELASHAIRECFDLSDKKCLSETYRLSLEPYIKELKIAKRFRDWTYSPLRHLGYHVLKEQTHYYKLAGVLHGTKTYSRLPFYFRWP
jgi:geranylgeranyl reductase family protein